jgi:hypothetical protein
MPARDLALRVGDFAVARGLEGAERLDGAGTVMREMAGKVLRAIRRARGLDRL